LIVLEDRDGNPVDWPALRSNKLFVRPVYREFYEREDMLNKMAHRKRPRAAHSLVRGIPGIGKSSFGMYCLWRLVKEGNHVLYSYPVGLGEGSIAEFGSGPVVDAIFIADGTGGFASKAKRKLLVTSPRQAYIPEFAKHSEPFFMPAPSIKEIKLLRNTCFVEALDSLSDAILDARIRRWGCVPRFVLDHEKDEAEAFTSTIALLNVTALSKSLLYKTEVRDQQDVSFRVLHYDFLHERAAREAADTCNDADATVCEPADMRADAEATPTPTTHYGWPLKPGVPLRNYSTLKLRWATETMEDCVWEFLKDSQYRDRLELLGALFRDRDILSFSGNLWEKWVSVAIARGSGSDGFRIRRLDAPPKQGLSVGPKADALLGKPAVSSDRAIAGDNTWRLTVRPAINEPFTDLCGLQDKMTAHAAAAALDPSTPRVRFIAPTGFASIDFIEAQLPRVAVSNATVSEAHVLLVQGQRLNNGLRAISEALPVLREQPDDPIIFLWLVPSSVFPNSKAKKQEYAVLKGINNNTDTEPSADADAPNELAAASQRARELGPYIVQYAVEVPLPDAQLHFSPAK
jgi:hypothetical protein